MLSDSCVQDVITAWNKAVRRIFNLPYNTHTNILPCILEDKSLKYNLHLRTAKYIRAGLVSKNPLVHYFFNKAQCDLTGSIGCNIRYFMYTSLIMICTRPYLVNQRIIVMRHCYVVTWLFSYLHTV